MNSRDFFVLAIVEQAVVLGALLYVLGAWLISRRGDRRPHPEPPRFKPFDPGSEAAPQQPFLVWINSLPRLGETPTAPLRSLRHDGFSVHLRD
jgi:hypothetical protein